MNKCVDCKHARWDRTKAGAMHPSGGGRCGYPVVIPALPRAFYWLGQPPLPRGGYVNRREEPSVNCIHFEEGA